MSEITDKSMILEWLELMEHNQNRAIGTVNKYHAYLTRLSEFLKTRGKDLRKAEKEDLEQFTGIVAHQRGMLPRSRRPLVAAVRKFYFWAKEQWYVDANPAADLSYPTTGERLPNGMTLKNAGKLLLQPGLDDFKSVRDTAILSLFMGCGLRVGGLASLNQEDLIFTEIEDKEWMLVRVIEKGDRERLMPAPHEARLLLRAYLGHPDLKRLDRTLEDGRQVLFVSMHNNNVPPHEYHGKNTRLNERNIHRMIVKHGEAAGIPRDQCHPHALRHLYGTELTESDVQQRKIQVLLGHACMKSTARYQHVAMRSLATAVEEANPLSKLHTPVTDLAKQLT
ncbi:MAG: tyrosine-type recombinase/integrase [Gammaproteobacteria bacterium]|nr:tyrosine-type recombinase/integrase [Gammaproteobacteria bacterium]